MNLEEMTNVSVEVLTQWGLKVVGAVALLIIGRMVAGILRRVTRKAMKKADVDATLIPFMSSMVYYLALAVVVIAVLGLFGIQTTSLIAILGAAGLAVGLALQGTLSNFAAGVMLLVFRPFKVGDFIVAGRGFGRVRDITDDRGKRIQDRGFSGFGCWCRHADPTSSLGMGPFQWAPGRRPRILDKVSMAAFMEAGLAL